MATLRRQYTNKKKYNPFLSDAPLPQIEDAPVEAEEKMEQPESLPEQFAQVNEAPQAPTPTGESVKASDDSAAILEQSAQLDASSEVKQEPDEAATAGTSRLPSEQLADGEYEEEVIYYDGKKKKLPNDGKRLVDWSEVDLDTQVRVVSTSLRTSSH